MQITEVVLVHFNIVNNDCQQNSRVLYIFVLNKTFGSSLQVSPSNFIFLKIFKTEFQTINVCFTDQNIQLLEIEDKALLIK